MKMTAQEYARRVRRTGPHSPLLADIAWAFCVGGGICLLGEVLRQRFLAAGIETELAGTLTSCSLIALSAVLTTLGWYQKLAARAGAGSLVPITGFANAVVSAASAGSSASAVAAPYTAAEPVCRSRISGSTNRSAALPNSEMICPSTTCTNGPIVSSFLFHLQTVGL